MSNLEHVDIPAGEIHQPHNWKFADAAARTAAVITDATLIEKMAIQMDDGSMWLLSAVSPAVWFQVGGASGGGGTPGVDGKTVRNGSGVPSVGLGVDGDFYIDTTAWNIYGPKAGTWGAGTSLIGPQGIQGIQGTAGADGKTVRSGSGAPAGGLGVAGDFYIDYAIWNIYGPKAGTWGSPTSLIGPAGGGGGGSALAISEDGTLLTSGATSINFVGYGTATAIGTDITYTVVTPTKTTVGLANVDNTADSAKPVSTAQQSALDGKEPSIASGTGTQYWKGDKTWAALNKAAVGLSNVDNTSDANKPVSTAQQAALDAKEGTIVSGTLSQFLRGDKAFVALAKTDVGLGNVDNTADSAKPVSTAQATADTAALNSAKAYADSLVVGLWDDRGNYNASTNLFPATGGSGASGAVLKGDIWTVSVGGTLGGTAVIAGQTVRATIDTPGQTAGNWAISIAGTAQIDDSITDGVTGRAPSQNAVFDALALKENAITAAATTNYLRGDKTFVDFATDVRAALLTGLSTATNAAVTATDSVLGGIGKLQKQVTDFLAQKDATGGIAGLTLFKINFKNAANTFTSFFTNTNTAARTYTFPDYDATVATVAGTETLTNKTLTSSTLGGTTVASGPINLKHGGDIVAATTLNLDTATGDIVDVTGNTTITAITLSDGVHRWVRFTGTPVLTNGANLVIPGAANITMQAGDYMEFIGYAAGVVRAVAAPSRGVSLTASGTDTLSNKTLSNPIITNFTESGAAPAAAASYTVDLTNGTDFSVTTNANFTLTVPLPVAGKSYTVEVIYGGAHTLTIAGGGGTVKWQNGAVLTPTSVSGKSDLYIFKCNRAGTYTMITDGGRNFS